MKKKLRKLVHDVKLKNDTEIYLIELKNISTALDIKQKYSCTIRESIEVWLRLKIFFENECNDNDVNKIQKKH